MIVFMLLKIPLRSRERSSLNILITHNFNEKLKYNKLSNVKLSNVISTHIISTIERELYFSFSLKLCVIKIFKVFLKTLVTIKT